MTRIISFFGLFILFILWALYKIFIDRKTTKQDISDIKLGIIFVTIAAAVFYFIFFS